MDTGHHELANLFDALGLPNQASAIDDFIRRYKLPPGIPIFEAPIWNAAQKEMLRTAIEEDSDWAEAVDTLATLLSK
ncbi:MAG: DUF2789 domain-containing protein [Burkholderiales bacterium]|nr:DUF2789 domain-containing protein [Burkholderiales bacterium]